MRNTKAALIYITDMLKGLNIPFEIDGGLAAKVYGSKRELADIDINIPLMDFHRLVPFVEEFIIYGPEQYKDDKWDLLMMSLKHSGQIIDIGALGNMKYFDLEIDAWTDFPSDLSNTREVEFEGIKIPVINEVKLLIYKSKLHRGVDLKDIDSMENQLFGNNS